MKKLLCKAASCAIILLDTHLFQLPMSIDKTDKEAVPMSHQTAGGPDQISTSDQLARRAGGQLDRKEALVPRQVICTHDISLIFQASPAQGKVCLPGSIGYKMTQ